MQRASLHDARRRASLLFLAVFVGLLCLAHATSAPAQTAAVPRGSDEGARILVVGDSLSAEYGLPRGAGWVSLLAQRIESTALGYEVVNASISGDTTAGGLGRLPALLTEHRPAIVVLELGGNDALRGLDLAVTEHNLSEMARLSREAGAQVLVLGMQIPPNYGRAYATRFASVFESVAQAQQAELVPFFLEGIATDPAMFQADRIHPATVAQPIMLDNVWPALEPLLHAAGQNARSADTPPRNPSPRTSSHSGL
ncbi:arylesterase [Verticiella sediminum]|uniref:Arylesterase n=1 Tax=Verticiella sediminum TaxID=1247510 RepID=A0A556ABT0_9BURK|nr:arylesterase [Verticiella sediminum]TSH90338.1 arylesterase [Verticiella sediminum]